MRLSGVPRQLQRFCGVWRAPSRVVYLLDNRLKAVQARTIVAIDPRRDALVFVAKQRGPVVLGHASLAQAVAHSVAEAMEVHAGPNDVKLLALPLECLAKPWAKLTAL
jgi:hypothetical protein